MTFAYYPLYQWVHEHLAEGKLPLISDLAYNGAPVAAVEMIGILSPVLWLLHLFPSFNLDFNLLFLCPLALYLSGSYFLGLHLGLSRSASLLLAFLWTYNGHQMAQLDHLNVVWAHAFFPWAFLGLVEYLKSGKTLWLIFSGFLFGLNVLSGHPQIAFLEGLFFLAWIFLSNPSPLLNKLKASGGLFLGALATSSAQLLFTLECQGGESFNQWGEADRFFHSWTPLNFLTLVFPWFFGKEQFDRAGTDYWWQYQFVEMQVSFGLIGLFFILLFFMNKNSQRRWIEITGLLGLLMAFGKFFFVYSLVQRLPFFSLFRDPARYWFLITWAIGLGAAYAWDEWFKDIKLVSAGQKLCWGLIAFTLGVLLLGWFFLNPGKPLLQGMASWAIGHFISGDGIHTQPISVYLGRISEKLDALAYNLDPRQPRVFLPLLFLGLLTTCVFNRQKWNLNFQKGFLLLLLFADLMAFRMPVGNSFYNPADIPQPSYPAPQNRSLVLLSGNVSPLPPQYGEMAFPNMNFLSNRPNIAFVANPHLPRYFKILADLGWFSWVYKDRDPLGFTRHVEDLQMLGVDQIVSDIPLKLPKPFLTLQNKYPYVYLLTETIPKANVGITHEKTMELNSLESKLRILKWNETNLSLVANRDNPTSEIETDILFLQKTFLPGWKAVVNNKKVEIKRDFEVLMSVPLVKGDNQVELNFEPVSLRLGFFLFFVFFGVFTFSLFRRLVA